MDKDNSNTIYGDMKKEPDSADAPLELYCDKLEASSLFRSYSQALATATGCRISLATSEHSEGISIPVEVTFRDRIWMKVEPQEGEADDDLMNVLRSFAIQLSEEAGRSVLSLPSAAPPAVIAARDCIRDRIAESSDISDVSQHTGVSQYRLCRLFRRHTGITMTEYANRLRVEKAKRLLETPSLPVMEVAERAGFVSLSQFNRTFLRFVGCSPSDFRISLRQMAHMDLLE